MKTKLLILSLLSLLSLSASISYADSCCSSTLVGAALGTTTGAFVGHALGGCDGAVLGAVVGGLGGAAIGHDTCQKEHRHKKHHRHHKHKHHRKHRHHSKREHHHHYYNEPTECASVCTSICAPAPVCTTVCAPICTPVVERRVYTQPVYVERPYTVRYREVYQPQEVVYSCNTFCY